MIRKLFPKTLTETKVFLETLSKSTLSLDTETDGLRYGCKLKGISLCDGKLAGYINLDNNHDKDFIIAEIHNVLEEVNLLILHNSPFDLRALRWYGIEYSGKIFDTQVAAHLLNENKPCGLKDLAIRVLKVPKEQVLEFEDIIKLVNGDFSDTKFLDYGINDSIYTYQLYEVEKPLLDEQGLDKLFYEIEMPFQFVLVDLFINGVKIDTKKLSEFDSILTEERAKAEKDCVKSIGLKMIEEKDLFGFVEVKSPINLNSSQQLAKVIEGQLGFKLPKTDPSDTYPEGQPSTCADVLEPLRNKHPFINYLLRYRKCEKLLNTFIRPLYVLIDSDGRLRTSFNDCIAGTGRLSSSHPNLQNIPKLFNKETDIVNIRELFIAEKDECFIRADYDLQEIRQLANVSKDKNLIATINSNQDIHLASANGCLNLGLSKEQLIKSNPEFKALKEKYKKERDIGKNGINFPVVYGSTKYGISFNNNVSLEEAQSWVDGFHRLYPEVRHAMKKCEKELISCHYVKTYFGRKRRFYISQKEISQYYKGRGGKFAKKVRQAFNMKIQGMCADLLRVVMVALREYFLMYPEWNVKLRLTVHDEIILSCNIAYSEQVMIAIKHIMETSAILDVPFLTEIKKCFSYGD